MIRTLLLVLAVGLWSPLPGLAQSQPEGRVLDVLHYRFNLTLSDETDDLQGVAEIRLRFLEAGQGTMEFDLVGMDPDSVFGMRVLAVTRQGKPLTFLHRDNRLSIHLPSPGQAGDEALVRVTYEGIPADGLIIGPNKHGDRAFFGDNWPNRARYWLPTVDHPSDKATVEWLVTAPNHYRVVGTGSLVERKDLGDGTALTHWASSVPVATKVMVMGAARFAVRETGRVGSVPIQAWVYPQDSVAGFSDFARAEEAVRFFESRIGPFPYAKLANVQSKTRYGGMENASNIFYSERAVRGDGGNEGLIVHEVAHQWFGDSVTEEDWPHIWLSEGFATYLTHVYNEATYGRDRLVEGMLRDRRTVVRFLEERPNLALVPEGMADPNVLLNRNAYQKGGWVLHMLRRQVGDEAFWIGIRRYYERYRDENARTRDLQEVFQEVSGQELEWFFQEWAFRPGHPSLAYEWEYDADSREVRITLRQTQSGPPFRFPLDIGIHYPGEDPEVLATVEVEDGEAEFTLPVRAQPDDLILDPDCWLLFQAQDAKPAPAGNPTGAG